jgi:sterol 3beta-glucosyltransferase
LAGQRQRTPARNRNDYHVKLIIHPGVSYSKCVPSHLAFLSTTMQASFDITSGDEEDTLRGAIVHIRHEANKFDKVLRDDSGTRDGFDQLVAKDLNSQELAAVGRSAQLYVAGTSWVTDGELSTEPESYDSSVSPEFHRVATLDTDKWKLEPTEIVRLLVQEFGALGEDEKLIFEADAVMFSDVLIVGVLHLTTHRLTYHASLLSVRPEIAPSQQVIKAGPVTFFPSRSRKRRAWMELTHDMLCTYASSSSDDHLRPLRSILLSYIQEMTQSPDNSRRIQLVLGEDLNISGLAEFDTEEAAQEWKKEVTAAIFLQRHCRREAIGGDFSDTNSGVRFSYPLHKITKVKRADYMKKNMADIQVDGLEQDSRRLLIGPVMDVPAWAKLQDYIDEAKRSMATIPEAPVVVDFGPLTFDINPRSLTPSPVDAKEHALRKALGLGAEPELWSNRARLFRAITCFGYFVITPHYVGFWGKYLIKQDVKHRLPMRMIKSASPITGRIPQIHGLSLAIEGSQDLKFQFKTQDIRDEVIRRINEWRALTDLSPPSMSDSTTPSASTPSASTPSASTPSASTPFTSSSTLVTDYWPNTPSSETSSTRTSTIDAISPPERTAALVASVGMKYPFSTILSFPKIINFDSSILINQPSLHFVCLTIGSRGDVQPYIALGINSFVPENHQF